VPAPARGGSHEVVLLPGVAACGGQPSGGRGRTPPPLQLLARLYKAACVRGAGALTESPPARPVAVALSWVPGDPTPRGEGDPAGLRQLLDTLSSVALDDLDDLLGPCHAYAGGERWPELMAECARCCGRVAGGGGRPRSTRHRLFRRYAPVGAR